MKIIEPLQKFKKSQTDIVLFLGGTCSSKNWRRDLILFLEDMNKTLQLSNLVIINPYRKDWPSTIDKLSQQIEWECQMIYQSDIFSAYFEKTGGNFTFFELGKAIKLRDGNLSDLGPTILDLAGIEKPAEMTSASLIVKK